MQNNTTETVNKNRLGEELLQQGIINQDQINIALKEQKKSIKPLGEELISLGFINEKILRETLSHILDEKSVDLQQLVPDPQALELIPKTTSIRLNIIPVNFDSQQNTLSIAITDTYNLSTLDHLRSIVGQKIKIIPLLAGESEIAHAIDNFYGHELSVDGILHEIETGEIDYTSFNLSSFHSSEINTQNNTYQQPLMRLVDAILADAVKQGASDIHFEPEAGYLRLRYRIDGVLQAVRSLHKDYWPAILVRLKVMSNMNIAETRAPQDGRIHLNIRGQNINFRASSFPTTHGENFVLRVLDQSRGIVPLHQLGMHAETLTQLKRIMARPEGIILVTGPTGSGKTTTLYSMLDHVRSVTNNIMTLEDPVEYPMEMIRQTSINEVSRLSFAQGIRAILRQDPDIILVGEIRDADTAEMTLRAAMTGHQVYSTLHTNSAIGAIARLMDIGVKAEILTGNIIGIVAQRLIRCLCPYCKSSHQANDYEKTLLNININESIKIYTPQGCNKCQHTGYKNRLAIIEVLKINNELDEMIARQASIGQFKQYLQQQNIKSLADDATHYVLEGLSSIDEISRVIDLTDRLQ